jgi:hypothetical protein
MWIRLSPRLRHGAPVSQQPQTQSVKKSQLVYNWRFTANQSSRQAPFRIKTKDFLTNSCGHGPYVTSSLAKGWVCNLQLLLALASAVILGSESHGTHNHTLLFQIRDSHNLEGQVPIFISPRKRVAQLHPQAPGYFFFHTNKIFNIPYFCELYNTAPKYPIYP